ncbi:signal peptidase I [Breznakia sp. PF5-3]|uniref:signal peptidase I n=1 Tax=unclassified Breznakia TaxID=2623764 RepID=UPI002404C1B3|nr:MULTISPECIES: signal peptidase I [unclassified Breznakia]MDL2276255.1 signal peptidase I [Breznakia sp. OttesenSCG-928-G09]MDF9824913.1 signal peptidase I [Breznakia sp. PM6-1]MDF9835588.1 signal peptidase I [Breznakia sp. PF5-3]MDF9837996.1 signal peptidase I [Breznakia sp. PFB2-8]MDF9859985.1 signal peptidase I [Breznakia sp. PH5-24]
MKKFLKVMGNIVFYTIIFAVVLFAFLFSMNGSQDKSIFGYRFYDALSESMSPQISKGDLLIVEVRRPNEIKVGDIITYTASDDGEVTVTHRVVEIQDEASDNPIFITQGDANKSIDPPVQATRVIGVVKGKLPMVGYISSFVKRNVMVVITMVISCIGFIVSMKVLKNRSSKKNILEGEKV